MTREVSAGSGPVRIDVWLWAARFFKTRGLAQTAIEQGRVRVGGERVKPARPVRLGETLSIEPGDGLRRVVAVCGLSSVRGPAAVAVTLYQETAESLAARQAELERRRLFVEPAQTQVGRPTKRDRRALTRLKASA